MIDFDRRLNELMIEKDGKEKYYKDLCNDFYDVEKDKKVSSQWMISGRNFLPIVLFL